MSKPHLDASRPPVDRPEYTIKDSGERAKFESGMVRDVTTGKIDWHRTADGPMLRRWADHLTKGKQKYADVRPGVPNWTLADGEQEYERFRQSAYRHFMDWFNGLDDEDHGAAVFFNINGAEYVRARRRPATETCQVCPGECVNMAPALGGSAPTTVHDFLLKQEPVYVFRDGDDVPF